MEDFVLTAKAYGPALEKSGELARYLLSAICEYGKSNFDEEKSEGELV